MDTVAMSVEHFEEIRDPEKASGSHLARIPDSV